MNKQEAIQWFKEVKNKGIDRDEVDVYKHIPRNEISIKYWNNVFFSGGMDYGALWAIWKIFDLKPEDLDE